jgi:hypothetical protein
MFRRREDLHLALEKEGAPFLAVCADGFDSDDNPGARVLGRENFAERTAADMVDALEIGQRGKVGVKGNGRKFDSIGLGKGIGEFEDRAADDDDLVAIRDALGVDGLVEIDHMAGVIHGKMENTEMAAMPQLEVVDRGFKKLGTSVFKVVRAFDCVRAFSGLVAGDERAGLRHES